MLINCVTYQNGSRLADIDIEEISNYIQRPDCFIWVALRDAHATELALLISASSVLAGSKDQQWIQPPASWPRNGYFSRFLHCLGRNRGNKQCGFFTKFFWASPHIFHGLYFQIAKVKLLHTPWRLT